MDLVADLRKPRVGGVAVFDALAALALAVVAGVFLLRLGDDVTDWATWFICFAAIIVVGGYALGVKTALGQAVGVDGADAEKRA